jgi:hypothetical protein
MLIRYGVSNNLCEGKLRDCIKKTWIKKYGVDNPNKNSLVRDKIVATCTKKYGSRCSLQASKEKIKRTLMLHYGVTSPIQNKEIQNRVKATCVFKYGVENPSQYPRVKKLKKKTCLKNYGVESPLQSKEIKIKFKNTCMSRYGVYNPAQNPEIHKKQFSNRKNKNNGYLSKSEYKFSLLLTNGKYTFRSEYFINGHHFDFAVFKNGKLDTLVEIDGEFHHSLLNDCDGKFILGKSDHLRFSKCKGYKLIVIDSLKIKEGFKEFIKVYSLSYKMYLKRMVEQLLRIQPNYSFSNDRMFSDYAKLKKYSYRKGANLGRSIILNFCKSYYENINWKRENITELVNKHLLYYSKCSSHNPLDCFDLNILNVSRLAKRYKNKYKGYKIVYIKKHKAEKMLAICSLNKTYRTDALDEDSIRMAKLLKLKVI